MIDDRYKVISIDIPRTACSERIRLIAGMPWGEIPEEVVREKYWNEIPKHARASIYMAHSPDKFSTYFKFSFVRNPWARMVSFFKYRLRSAEAMDFTRYIIKDPFGDLRSQQIDYLTDRNGKILVDFIGRFENLYEDFEKICQQIKFNGKLKYLPERLNFNYWSYYDDKTRKIVARKFRGDIENFGYSFLEK